MSGYITEFFGYPACDKSEKAIDEAAKRRCPFLSSQCTKILSRDNTISGVCAIRLKSQDSPSVICCPNRMYANNYELLHIISKNAFNKDLELFAGRVAVKEAKIRGGAVAVFGHGWGGELKLPQRKGTGAYFVDWILACLNENGDLVEFTAIEVQTIDTTGNYRNAREALLENRKIEACTVGLNWENVSKRIIPQIIYKGQVLQRESLCNTGLYFVCPLPVYERVLTRLGGEDKLPSFPTQPASIHFIAYDYKVHKCIESEIIPLGIIKHRSTTVYKVQEAFSSVSLPDEDVIKQAIQKSLYD